LADLVEYGLSPTGFKRKRLPEVISSINARIKDTLGKPIQTSANSVLGQIVGVFAYEIADEWEQLENSYNAMYPSTAQGTSLSNVAGLAGIQQIEAEYTTVVLTCFGTEGFEVPYLAQATDGKYVYSCQDVYLPIEASRSNVIGIRLASTSIVAGTEYILTIDDDVQTYTATASDTVTSVLSGLMALFSFDDRTMENNNGVLMIRMNDSRKSMAVYVNSAMNITIVASPFNFKCDTAGAIDPNIGTITQIVTSYAGWNSVENDAPAAVGRDAETDNALRARWSRSVYNRASSMVEAIQAALYNVDGVSVAVVYENASNDTDADGRPPHSIEAIVDGGDGIDIGKAIWTHKAAGIDTYGSESAVTYDSQGVAHTMYFNRPTQVPVYLHIEITENPEKALSSAAVVIIKQALVEKGNALGVGKDVILQSFFCTIMTAASNAVGYIQMTASTDGTTYSTSNVIISPREVATFAESNIVVEVVT